MTLPVHLPEQNDDGSFKDGLDFSDYTRCQTQTNSGLFKGRTGCPSWASNLRELGELLARYMERRAGYTCPRVGTPQRRIIHAQTKIIADRPARIATLDKLTAEYMALKTAGTDPDRLRVVERQIRALDGKLVIDKHGPSLVVGIVQYYFRCGYDSVETAGALNHVVSPVGVRQITHRLTQLWEQMQDGGDRKPSKDELRKAETRARWRLSGYCRKQSEKEKAERAAETPEEREARLRYHREYYYAHRDRIAAQQRANWKKRDKAMERYRSLTPAQIEERRRKAREYAAKKREKLNAYARTRHAALVAKMSEEEKAIRRAQSRAYADAHRERIREVHAAHRARKKAEQEAIIAPESSLGSGRRALPTQFA